jgi:hypothetical protein
MPLDPIKQKQIMDILLLSLDGEAGIEEMQKLKEILESSSEARNYYLKALMTAESVREMDWEAKDFEHETDKSESFNAVLWNALADDEKTAPVVQIAKAEVKSEQEQDTAQMVPVRKISKFPIITAIASCAALLMIFAYVYLNPQMSEVATLTDSINSQWSTPQSSVKIGSRLSTTREPVMLEQGIIKILYDNDIEVLIEAPAEYQIRSAKEISLKTGSLFARVSQAGKGFSVKTSNATIVDLGTEFGVRSSQQDKTELHVFKGKTTLTATADRKGGNLGVISGQAREVGVAGDIKDIQINKEGFVRAIDSKTNLVWKGQNLDLADIVSLGNGQGSGKFTGRINPVGGYTDDENTPDIPTKGYLPLTKSPFIDGIFVPNGAEKQIVSTQGDVFGECPSTSGIYHADLVANPRLNLFKAEFRKGTIRFDGQVYGDRDHPCVVFHANLGVTFNLNAIRAAYPERTISRFVSKIGIADLEESHSCNADFWVLIDGKVRYSMKNVKQKGLLKELAVEISPTDRFLTLAVTDGGDEDMPGFYNRAITCDWGVFVGPVLELE